jgi:DNA mismatch endonuclease, patch repair protein
MCSERTALKGSVVVDVLTRAQRHKNMSANRSTDTKLERTVRGYLHRRGLRFFKNVRKLPGCPDVVFPRRRLVVFINGCFWHKHECKLGQPQPKTREEWWEAKRNRTVERDEENMCRLRQQGWKVLVIWECESRDESNLAALSKTIKATTASSRSRKGSSGS